MVIGRAGIPCRGPGDGRPIGCDLTGGHEVKMVGTRSVPRSWILAVAVACSLSGLAGCGSSSAPVTASAARPNIVFVLTDDLTANLVRYMPHVQAIERNGVSFTNYTVSDSLCCPSRASIFTGDYPHTTGVFTNGGS